MSDSESSSSPPSPLRHSGLNWDYIHTTIANARIAEDREKWLVAVGKYVAETQVESLDISSKGIGVEDVKLIFRSLPNSQVTELNLANNNLSGGMEDLVQMLLTTKISKLDIYNCSFSKEEILQLMENLKNSHVTELVFWNDDKSAFSLEEGSRFISHLVESHLTFLDFDLEYNNCYMPCGIKSFLQALPSTSIANLSLSGFGIPRSDLSEDVILSLFSNLSYTALTHLSLPDCNIDEQNVKKLSVCLKDSKLISLDLSNNYILDEGLDALAVGLVYSKITTLNLCQVSANGSNVLGLCLKDSQITSLALSLNHVDFDTLFSFPDFLRLSSLVTLDIDNSGLSDELGQVLMRSLKFSKITKLNVSGNKLQLLSALEFAKIVKDTDLTDVDLSWNYFPVSGIVALGDCLKDSKIKRIRLGNNPRCRTDPLVFSAFLEKTKESSVESVFISGNHTYTNIEKTFANNLVNTKIAHFSLVWDVIEDDVMVSLAEQLKFTSITHLALSCLKLSDTGLKCLASCLNETQIVDLDVSHNDITNYGVYALAVIRSDASLLRLNLAHNKIENEGFEALARHAEGTFITLLDLSNNPGTRFLIVDRILLENKISAHRLVSFFKQIAPKASADSFHLDESVCGASVDVFLEECLQFYKTVIELPSAVSVLVEVENLSFSRDQIVSLLEKKFPQQFASFIMNRIEATVTQLIDFIKRVEELGLNQIVELLILNRPALMIDSSLNILHPYAYQLLHKYKQPLYNSSVEPDSKVKIINYFSEHSSTEGAIDVINLLHGYNM